MPDGQQMALLILLSASSSTLSIPRLDICYPKDLFTEAPLSMATHFMSISCLPCRIEARLHREVDDEGLYHLVSTVVNCQLNFCIQNCLSRTEEDKCTVCCLVTTDIMDQSCVYKTMRPIPMIPCNPVRQVHIHPSRTASPPSHSFHGMSYCRMSVRP